MKMDYDTLYDCMNSGMMKGIYYCSRGDIAEAVNVLRSTLDRAELIHSYLGFLEDDRRSRKLGLGPLVIGEEFTAEEIAWIRRMTEEEEEEDEDEEEVDEDFTDEEIEWIRKKAEEYENGSVEDREGEAGMGDQWLIDGD